MNIYVASSWRNPWQQAVVRLLREMGQEVYDFRNPENNPGGFHWTDIDSSWKTWTPSLYREALNSPVAERGFKADMDALKNCDLCLLVQPCGTSSHLELGWAVGARKLTMVLFPFDFRPELSGHSCYEHTPCPGCGDMSGCHLPAKLNRIEPELMVKMCDHLLLGRGELITRISQMKEHGS